ncbi:MAG: DegT/DnrJ/EryC1/StrS family aminotransferase [Burkholderiaceae bacterium]|jgi:dTDP-4-amino-4,6-dideoxygalactose transaminase
MTAKTLPAAISAKSLSVEPPLPANKAERDKTLYVTQSFLPPLDEFMPYLEDIWQSRQLTNGGPQHQAFEAALAEHLGVKHISLFTNCTIGLVTALQALRISGEVITTPYSFVATAHSLLWNDIKPVFADIDPLTFNLDPARIEAAITPQTAAIMPVHCYGNPADIDAIQRIADVHGLKVIYDAAHAFDVKRRGESILNAGDLSVLSFHATKVFNTFEGGAIISPDAKTKRRIDYLKNFGFADEVTVVAPGINGKMSELNAAVGRMQLKHIDAVLARRAVINRLYRQQLADIRHIQCLTIPDDVEWNYAYFPVRVQAGYGCSRDALYARLKTVDIYSRRYFYPLISDMPMYRGLPSADAANLPHAQQAAQEILCLPIFPEMTPADVDRVVAVLRTAGSGA